MSETALTFIPAKRRSRRLPGKNLALLNGKTLLSRAIEQARLAGVCGEICVGTDDKETAQVAEDAGARVPFLRTGDCDDVTSVGEATCNFLRRYREELHRTFNYVCLLLPTSPLRAPEDIRGCFDVLLSDPSLDAAMSIVYAEKHPCWAWQFDGQTRIHPMFPDRCDLGRNQLPKPYYVDGAVYWAKADFFEGVSGNQYRGRVGGYIMPPDRAVDVDTPLDLAFCELLVRQREGAPSAQTP